MSSAQNKSSVPLEIKVTIDPFFEVKRESSPSPPTTPISTNMSPISDEQVSKLVKSRKRRSRGTNKPVVIKGHENRICEWCKSSQTPEWRTGPCRELLCNACGLQFKKLKKEQQTQT